MRMRVIDARARGDRSHRFLKGGGRRRTSGQTGCQTRERRGDGSTEHGGTVIGKGERKTERKKGEKIRSNAARTNSLPPPPSRSRAAIMSTHRIVLSPSFVVTDDCVCQHM